MSRAPRGRPDVVLFAEVGAIDRLVAAHAERALPAGISYAGFSVLGRLIVRGDAENPARLAQASHLTKGAITNTLKRLEAHGYVSVRGDDRDGRRKQVAITGAGLAAYERALLALKPMIDDLRSRFSDADFAAVLPFLAALRGWLEEGHA